MKSAMKISWKSVALGAGILGGVVLILRMFQSGIGIGFQGIKWLGLDGLNLRFSLLYRLENANDIPATVSSLVGQLMYGDYRLNDLNIDQAVTVPPGGAERVEVKFTVKPGILLAEILRFLEEKEGFKRFRIKGRLSGKIGQVPFIVPLNETLSLADE